MTKLEKQIKLKEIKRHIELRQRLIKKLKEEVEIYEIELKLYETNLPEIEQEILKENGK